MIRFLQSGNKAAKYILGGFLVILAVSMVTYLIPGFMSGADTNARKGIVARVAGVDVETTQVERLANSQMRGRQVPEFYRPYLMKQAAQSLIQQAEIGYEARRMGLMVSDQELQDELQNGQYKQFLFPDGKWIGQKRYEELITQSGGTVPDFEKSIKDDLLQRKLFNTILAAVSATQAEVEQAYRDQNIKAKFQYAVLNLDDIQKSIKPTDAELAAFYETNKARYQNAIPEKRQIRYFILQDKDVENKVTVEPTELQRYYTDHQAEYRLPERIHARHILIKTPPPGPDGKVDSKAMDEARARAEDVLKQVKAGGDFAELAKKYSQDPGSASTGGELPWTNRGGFVAEFEKAAYGQNPGQISDLVKTDFGFHIIQTEAKEPARIKPFSEVKDSIEKIVKAQRVNALVDQAFNDAQALAKKQGLDKAAAQRGLQVEQSNLLSRTDTLPGIGPAPDVMSQIFVTTAKDGPQAVRFPQGYVIFELAKIEPARTPPLAEIKDRVTTDFKNQRAQELLTKKTQELADRAHAEHDLAKAAKEAGAAVKTSDLVDRNGQVPDIGSMGQASVAFTLKPGEISGPLTLGKKGVVLQVTDRQEPSLTDDKFKKERDGLQEQLTQQKKNQALQLFMTSLESRLTKEGKLKINNNELTNMARSRS